MAPLLPGLTPDRIGPDPLFLNNRTTGLVLRLDRLHPLVSGNKWFKLQPYLEKGAAEGKRALLTWGGPWSNHLLAAAAAARALGWKALGLVRGEAPVRPSPTLVQCAELGMELRYLDRAAYRAARIPEDLGPATDWLVIPEGGYGPLGAAGAAGILAGVPAATYTHIVAAVGTGTMLAGLIRAAPLDKVVVGVPVLRPAEALASPVAQLLPSTPTASYALLTTYHFGGYARTEPRLLSFMNDFYTNTGIPTDIVYTGKLFFAVVEESRPGGLLEGARPLVIHSGGLQGNRSLPGGTLIFPAP